MMKEIIASLIYSHDFLLGLAIPAGSLQVWQLPAGKEDSG